MQQEKEKKTKITPYQLKKIGFKKDGNCFKVPLPGLQKWLVYEDNALYLSNVFLNFLRDVDYIEQVQLMYEAITDKKLHTI